MNAKIWEISRQEFDDVIDTNIKGTANVLRHFIPLLIPKNQGVIVNITSIFGRMGAPLVCICCPMCKIFIDVNIKSEFHILF